LEKDRELRYQHASDMRADLQRRKPFPLGNPIGRHYRLGDNKPENDVTVIGVAKTLSLMILQKNPQISITSRTLSTLGASVTSKSAKLAVSLLSPLPSNKPSTRLTAQLGPLIGCATGPARSAIRHSS
jgi:hypothetical protein